MRKPIFDTIRAQRGKGFTAEEVGAIDALLDQLGVEKDDAAVAPTVPDPPTAASSARRGSTTRRHSSIRCAGPASSGARSSPIR